jgi:hypothetical protein
MRHRTGSHSSSRRRYLPGVVQEQRWTKQQARCFRFPLRRRVELIFSLRRQAIDSLIKKSGSRDGTTALISKRFARLRNVTLPYYDSLSLVACAPCSYESNALPKRQGVARCCLQLPIAAR